MSKTGYPPTRRDDSVVDLLHGRSVADPYRWLEDPDAPATAEWVDQQNIVTQDYLSHAAHLRPPFRSTVETLLNYDKYSAAWRRGPFHYYYRHLGLANQAVLMQAPSIDADPIEFLDPNTMADDGTVSLGTLKWSFDGAYLAYGVKRGGSDWEEIRIMDCRTRSHLDETLEWAKFTSIAWTHDGNGFYYARYPPPASLEGVDDVNKRGAETDQSLNQSVYYHHLNTPQSEDRLVYSDTDNPKRMYSLSVTLDGSYLMLFASEDCSPKNQVWTVDLDHFGKEADNLVRWVDASFDSQFSYLANDGATFYFLTNWDAPKFRIISAPLGEPLSTAHSEVVSEQRDVLSAANAVHAEQLALVYMRDAYDTLSIHRLRTGEKLYDVPLPDLGSVTVAASREDDFLTFQFSSFLYAGTVYYVDLTLPVDDGMRVFRKMDPPGFDPTAYETRQVFYTSKDGKTRVPMFVIAPRGDFDAAPPPKRPTLLYGYGGFMISLTPYFSTRWASWLQCMGGAVVIANIRGGAEYGSKWHDEGIIGNKQNVFDDFQYAARYLIDEMRMTEPKKLMIMGGSNGGLLVGACANQAPELYGAAVAQVGVMDMLRFHKFTIGSAWVSDFGSPDKSEEFEHLIKYSPLHNVFSPDERGVPYPAMLLTTGDHDDRVVPLHTLKYGAELQHKAGASPLQDGRPLLIRIDVKAGHGAGKPTSKVIDEICDTLLFAARALGVDAPAN